MKRMTDLVKVQSSFRPSVVLPGDFYDETINQHFVWNYIPTEETLDIFMILRESLQPGSENRAHLFYGTYGTGKSDLMLMIANYLTRDPNEPLLRPFFEKLQNLNSSKAEAIRQARQGKPPFLLVLLQAGTAFTFSSFILDGLAQALDKEHLAHLMVKTHYRAAIEQIHKWRNNQHSQNYKNLEQILEHNYSTTPEGLERDLAGIRADYAFDIFRNAVDKMFDMPFQPRDVIQRPADAFEEVSKHLDMNKYSGIYVICDEFSSLLQQLADSLTGADSKAIDNLAEGAVRSRSQQLHFTVVSLFPFTSTQGTTQLAQQSLERSGGRFKQHPLHSLDVEELIKHSITKVIPPAEIFRTVPAQVDDLLELAMTLWGRKEERHRDREWVRETIIYGAFPLHPLATYCLPSLNRSLAQNERTMFSFLRDETQGLASFISRSKVEAENAGYISLMPLTGLFEYFHPNLEEKRSDLTLTFKNALMSVGSELLTQNSNLIENILKALVLLEVVGNPSLSVDRTLIRHAVGLPQSAEGSINGALEQLEQTYTVYKDHAEHYHLILPGRANPLEMKKQIEQHAQSLAQSMAPSPVEMLNTLHRLDAVRADSYNRERGTMRQLATRFVTPSNLGNPDISSAILQNEDGLIWYVLASSEQDLNIARTEALQITRNNNRIVVAVPRRPSDLLTRFLRKQALENLRSKSQEHQIGDAQDLLSDTGQVGKDYITSFHRAYQAFQNPHEFDWYYRGKLENVRFSTDEIATTVMKEVFPKTPPHNAAQHLKNSTSKLVQEATDSLLRAPFSLPPVQGKKASQMILREGAKALGLITCIGKVNGYDEYEVAIPTKSHIASQEIWLLMENMLKKGESWESIVTTLKMPPYGLYTSVLQVFAAAFYRYHRECLEVCEANKMELIPIDVTGSTIEQLIRSSEKYVISYQPLNDMQRRFLRGLAERAFSTKKQRETPNTPRPALKRYTADTFLTWVKQLPEILQQATFEELSAILSEHPTDVITLALEIIKVSQITEAPKVASILLEELPRHLALPPDSNQWKENQVEQALALLESVCSILLPQNFFAYFYDHLFQQVRLIFGLGTFHGNQADLLKVVLLWKNQIADQVSLKLLNSRDARDLVTFVEALNEDTNIQEALFTDLPGSLGIPVSRHWNRMSIRDGYLQRLRDAKASVESVAAIEKQSPSSYSFESTETQWAQTSRPPALLNAGYSVKEEKAHLSTSTSSTIPDIEKPPTPSDSNIPGGNGAATITPLPAANPEPVTSEKPRPFPSSLDGLPPPKTEEVSSQVERAFSQVQEIFRSLLLEERRILLLRIQREYGEQ